MEIVIVIFWVIFALFVGFIAINKGRSGMGFFILSILLSPLLGLIIVLILGVNEEGLYNNGELKKCPNCKEYVKLGASICKHCGNDLSENHKVLHTNKNDSKKEDKVTKLIELSKLLEKGLITQEEFEKSKIELL